MKTYPCLLIGALLCSCATDSHHAQQQQHTQQQQAQEQQRAPQVAVATPQNLAELVTAFHELTGTNITYDTTTQSLLEQFEIRSVGSGAVLQIAAPEATASATPEFEILPLEHADAGELAQTLEALAQDASAGGTQPASIKVLSDPRTNSLLIMATPKSMEAVLELAKQLDKQR